MVWHFLLAENDLGLRVGAGLGITADDVRHLPPLRTQTLSPEENTRLANLGKNPPRDVDGFAAALKEMIEDEALRRSCAAAAIETAHDYTMDAIGPRWAELLADLRAARER